LVDAMTTLPDDILACRRLIGALDDETDPVLAQVVDRVRRRDALLPSGAEIAAGPLGSAGSPHALFARGRAGEREYLEVLEACRRLRERGTAAQRELAALSIAILEASSIVHRGALLVSRDTAEADARLASAAAALDDANETAWAALVGAAIRSTSRAA
jgi:hypothetical protein